MDSDEADEKFQKEETNKSRKVCVRRNALLRKNRKNPKGDSALDQGSQNDAKTTKKDVLESRNRNIGKAIRSRAAKVTRKKTQGSLKNLAVTGN